MINYMTEGNDSLPVKFVLLWGAARKGAKFLTCYLSYSLTNSIYLTSQVTPLNLHHIKNHMTYPSINFQT